MASSSYAWRPGGNGTGGGPADEAWRGKGGADGKWRQAAARGNAEERVKTRDADAGIAPCVTLRECV
ncbi:hypothetical protein PSP6_170163 [Paraburkholderia tropica]|nr:hypothetical protein PSP6_170163 [Paraburkholderia tropica]